MFDIAFAELFLLSVIALIILGPQRLPELMRTMGLWMGRMRRIYHSFKQEIDREVGMDDIRRQLHNEQIMGELKQVEAEAKEIKNTITTATQDAIREGEEAAKKEHETPKREDS